jgi:hypothetical protein
MLSGVEGLARLSSNVAFPSPGALSYLPLSFERDRPGFIINGGRPRSTFFIIDAGSNNDIDGQPAVSINNFDSIDTFQVFESPDPNHPWLSGTSSVAVTSRAGTNEFHGTIFDYHLNRRLGALSPMERRGGLARAPKFRSDTFGGTFGGPLLRDRLFFFGAFSREIERSLRFSDSTSSMLTPSDEGLRALADQFVSPTVNDLLARGPLASTSGNPRVTRRFLLPVLGVPVEFGEVVRLLPSRGAGYEAGGRLDYHPTPRDRFQTGYWYDSRAVTNVVGRQSAGYSGDVESRAQLGYLRWERVVSAQTTNELGFNFNRARRAIDSSAPESPSVIVGFRGLNYGSDPMLGSAHASTLYEIRDRLAHVFSRHTLNLGGQMSIRDTRLDYLPGRAGSFYFLTFEDFVLNRPAASVFAAGSPRSRLSELHPSFYLGDVWRARPNVTFSLALGYEIANQGVNQIIDRISERESDPARALFDTSLPLEIRVPHKVNIDYNNFSPRIGFAYSPRIKLPFNILGNEKSVIRGGISLSYDQTAYRPIADFAASAPSALAGVLTPFNTDLLIFPDATGSGALRRALGGDPRAYARTIIDPDYATPYSLVWRLELEREFNGKLTASAAYVGTRGGRLIRAIDGNPSISSLTAGTGPLRVYETSGRSIYHALQARADLRITNHLTGGFAYTLSRLVDDVPESGARFEGGPGSPASLIGPSLQSFAQNPFDAIRAERARSSLDRKHRFAGHFVWDLPLQRGQSGIRGRLLGGWKASGIIELSSGSPFTPLQYLGTPASAALFASTFSDRLGAFRPFAGNPQAADGTVAFSNAANSLFRFFMNPDGTPVTSPTGFIIAGPTGFGSGLPSQAQLIYNDFIVEQWARSRGMSPQSFGPTFASGRPFGDIGRNTLLGPGISNIDFALIKTTKLTEKVSLQFRSEFFNLFNHPNRGTPNFVLENSGGFGFNDLGETDAAPRRVRLALKLIF